MSDSEPQKQFIKQVFGGAWMTQALSVVAELGIADLLVATPCTAEDLARLTGTNAQALYRLLRALASVGVFAEDSQRRFCLTPLAQILRSDVPGSQRAMAIMMGCEFHRAWGELLHSVRTGEDGWTKHFGAPFFQHIQKHPERHGMYDAAMNGIHGPETAGMLDAYDFAGFSSVADIGGGNGQTLVEILRRHTHLVGILYELPGVADRARSLVAEAGLDGRCRIEAGDFFRTIPAGADAYVLRHIIHDWQDCEAIAILQRCREAMKPGSRILVVESIVPDANEPGFVKWLDLMMLLVGGRERTERQYHDLFSAAGLRVSRVIPTANEVSVIEGVAA